MKYLGVGKLQRELGVVVVGLCIALLACKKGDDSDKTEPAAADKFKLPRIGVEWCDKMLETSECTVPRYKKESDQVESFMVWKSRAKKWKGMDATAADAECKKKYTEGKEYAPKFESGLMVSCYKY